MYALPARENRHQSLIALAVISGPLSQRKNPGAVPRSVTSRGEDLDGLIGVDPAMALDRQRLAGELIHHVQQLEVVPVRSLIELKIDRPHVIRPLRP